VTSQLGQILVLLALVVCAIGAPVGFAAGYRRSASGLRWSRRLALLFGLLTLAATMVMEIALIRHDFSVSYVASVGSRATPLHITIVSLWSSLEGSILFWALVLGGFTAAVAYLQRRGHEDYLAYTLGTLFAIGVFFMFLIAGPADPFRPTAPPVPTDGPGPNPLLQNHLLMIIHPPMLYLGYVGMSVPFAMATAALLRGHLGATWLKPLRNWLLVPTSFLTLGIMLGGWWSYEVLGWGGYWAWDPVENASFLPWLTAVAALHSAVVQQQRGTLKAWTVILIQVTFLLTILGTFLTRSGVVNSVHSFTQSPIGPLFLLFLAICSVAVILVLSLRIDTLVSDPNEDSLASRETAFLLNNLLLVTLMFTVLVGTLYPIVAEAVRGVKVSVGEPYFNRMAVPVFLALLMLMGIGPALPWGRSDRTTVLRALVTPVPAALVGVAVAWLAGARGGYLLFTAALVGYALWVTAAQALLPARRRLRRGERALGALAGSARKSPRRLGAYVVHFGLIVTFAAVAVSSTYQQDLEATVRRGESVEIGRYGLTLDRVEVVREPHRTARLARIEVERGGDRVADLQPALNHYPTMREPIGTPAVLTSLSHDLYLTVMNVGSDGSIGLRAIVTPGVVWIWIGVLVMVGGTALCLIEPQRRVATVEVPVRQKS
jgi:cytochrome c-type biogenesis protein CcmF